MLLLEEVRMSIPDGDDADVEEELAQLDLLAYCRSALKRPRPGPDDPARGS